MCPQELAPKTVNVAHFVTYASSLSSQFSIAEVHINGRISHDLTTDRQVISINTSEHHLEYCIAQKSIIEYCLLPTHSLRKSESSPPPAFQPSVQIIQAVATLPSLPGSASRPNPLHHSVNSFVPIPSQLYQLYLLERPLISRDLSCPLMLESSETQIRTPRFQKRHPPERSSSLTRKTCDFTSRVQPTTIDFPPESASSGTMATNTR